MSQRLGILYIHGFRSSPASGKSKFIQAATLKKASPLYGCAYASPQLPSSPVESLKVLEKSIESLNDSKEIALVGSSLGGFYATILTERHHRKQQAGDDKTWRRRIAKTIVLNPGVFPARDLAKHVGKQQFWHFPEKEYEFTTADLGELVELEKEMAGYEQSLLGKYALLACKGDETLDWREMVIRYKGQHLKLVEGSDHGISDFQDHFTFVEDFLTSS